MLLVMVYNPLGSEYGFNKVTPEKRRQKNRSKKKSVPLFAEICFAYKSEVNRLTPTRRRIAARLSRQAGVESARGRIALHRWVSLRHGAYLVALVAQVPQVRADTLCYGTTGTCSLCLRSYERVPNVPTPIWNHVDLFAIYGSLLTESLLTSPKTLFVLCDFL